MLPNERPLFLRLLWGVNNEEKSFVLQENETREINVSFLSNYVIKKLILFKRFIIYELFKKVCENYQVLMTL